jgi:hypothetical protein
MPTLFITRSARPKCSSELPDGLEVVDARDVASCRDRLVTELVCDLSHSFFRRGRSRRRAPRVEGVRAGSSDAAACSGDDGDSL